MLNKVSGIFFVKTFFKSGPQSLEELQKQLSTGKPEWLDCIVYFGKRIVGSASYWCSKRQEVFSWLSHHLEKNQDKPSFFMTLSCAEYQWPDVQRLVEECIKFASNTHQWNKKHIVKIVNNHSLVVQEFFQLHVKAWLEILGKEIFTIKAHWICFEFAPSRGQIHAHMLVVSSNKDAINLYEDQNLSKKAKEHLLEEWAKNCFNMSASIHEDFNKPTKPAHWDHPSKISSAQCHLSQTEDKANCQLSFQMHKCSIYCMSKK